MIDALVCALWAPITVHIGGYLYLCSAADSNEIPENSGVRGGAGLPQLSIHQCANMNRFGDLGSWVPLPPGASGFIYRNTA